jgi:hypothetical protein
MNRINRKKELLPLTTRQGIVLLLGLATLLVLLLVITLHWS